jgi:two-component sensor histidine kinase
MAAHQRPFPAPGASFRCSALSVAKGLLDVTCIATETEVTLVWTERGGLPVVATDNLRGFGNKLVNRTLSSSVHGSIE